MRLPRLLFRIRELPTFLRISFARVLWQFLLPERKRQFQVFLWRQILSIHAFGLQSKALVGHLLLCSCERKLYISYFYILGIKDKKFFFPQKCDPPNFFSPQKSNKN